MGKFVELFSDVFLSCLTVGCGVAELWSRLLLFQLFQLAIQLSNMSPSCGAARQDIPLIINLFLFTHITGKVLVGRGM